MTGADVCVDVDVSVGMGSGMADVTWNCGGDYVSGGGGDRLLGLDISTYTVDGDVMSDVCFAIEPIVEV